MLRKCVIFIVTVVAMATAKKCNMPPSLWCSSEQTAVNCGVYEQCFVNNLPDTKAGPVNFTLYFESLCPDCQNFFKRQLHHTYMTLGETVMNLTLVPYGNARESKSSSGRWNFQCQHGKEECIGNLIETCAWVLLKDKTTSFQFIDCMEESNDFPQASAEKCAKKLQIDLGKITNCSQGDMGNQLEHLMAVQTEKLDPPHEYVPWVTLNGVHTEKIQKEAEKDILSLICETYTGVKPDACKNHEVMTFKKDRCFRNLQ